jgi:hypothetical protein
MPSHRGWLADRRLRVPGAAVGESAEQLSTRTARSGSTSTSRASRGGSTDAKISDTMSHNDSGIIDAANKMSFQWYGDSVTKDCSLQGFPLECLEHFLKNALQPFAVTSLKIRNEIFQRKCRANWRRVCCTGLLVVCKSI